MNVVNTLVGAYRSRKGSSARFAVREGGFTRGRSPVPSDGCALVASSILARSDPLL